MISQNQQIIPDKKIKGIPGGLANESRFGGDIRALRSRKVIRVPSKNTGNAIKIEQGWNMASKKKDVIKVTIGDQYAIVERSEFEEGMFAMTQEDEAIKYINPKIMNPNN